MIKQTDKKIKIIQIAPEFPPYFLGGGGLLVLNLSTELVNQGHIVNVLSGYYPTVSLLEKPFKTYDKAIRIEWLPLIPSPKTGFQLNTIMPPNLFSLVKLTIFLSKKDFDAVHIHGFGHLLCDFASIICRFFGCKYILTIHGFPKEPLRRRGLLKVIFDFYSKSLGAYLIKNASKTVAVSSSVAVECLTYVPENKIEVIKNSIDFKNYLESPYSEIDSRVKFGLSGKKVLLCIGRLSEAKGFQFVILSLRRLKVVFPNVHLVIVGKDDGYGYSKILKKKVIEEGVESAVTFTGGVSEEEKVALLWLADIVLIPSTEEAFGIVALEALAAGAPIVASQIGGLKEILSNDKYTLLVKSKDPEALADAAIKVLGNGKIALAAKANRFSRVESFDLKQMAQRYRDLYVCFGKNIKAKSE